MPPLTQLATEQYVSLITFRRNGVGVATPIWIAAAAGKLYAFTDGTSAKMRRLRVTDHIKLAACDMRGNVHGEWVDGRARGIKDPAVIKRAIKALARKYSWRFVTASFFSRLFGRYDRRAYLEITVGLSQPNK